MSLEYQSNAKNTLAAQPINAGPQCLPDGQTLSIPRVCEYHLSTSTLILAARQDPYRVLICDNPLYGAPALPSDFVRQNDTHTELWFAGGYPTARRLLGNLAGELEYRLHQVGAAMDPNRDVRILSLSEITGLSGRFRGDEAVGGDAQIRVRVGMPDYLFHAQVDIGAERAFPAGRFVHLRSSDTASLPASQEVFLKWYRDLLDGGRAFRVLPIAALRDFSLERSREARIKLLEGISLQEPRVYVERHVADLSQDLIRYKQVADALTGLQGRSLADSDVSPSRPSLDSFQKHLDLLRKIRDLRGYAVRYLKNTLHPDDPLCDELALVVKESTLLLRQGSLQRAEYRAWLKEMTATSPDKVRAALYSLIIDKVNTPSLFDPQVKYQNFPPGGLGYSPSPNSVLKEIVDYLREAGALGKRDLIIDIGSGTGATALRLHLLSNLPVRGVEFCEEYVRAASRHAVSLGITDVQYTCADARTFDYSEGTIFYMFNPFRNIETIELVFNQLRAVAEKQPITVVILHGPDATRYSWLHEVHCNSRFSIFKSDENLVA